MENLTQVLERLKQLKQLGFKIAIDDFGTGFSSLSYLKQMPLDILKIDQSFISKYTNKKQDLALIKSTLYLAQEFGLDVVVEGIETPEQHAILVEHDCRFGQGYLFSKPMTEADYIKYIQAITTTTSSDEEVICRELLTNDS